MFTQNYINHTWNKFFGLYSSSSSIKGIYGKNYTDTAGSLVQGSETNASYPMSRYDIGRAIQRPTFSASFGTGIYFGTGSTPAKVSDYTLESVITSGIEEVYSTVSIAKEVDSRYSVCGQYTLKNTSDEPINIYEIGCFVSIPTGSSTTKSVMMERTVLTEPITIGHGDTKMITYKLTFNHALNVEQ